MAHDDLTLITSGTGKTGSRVASRLRDRGERFRIASRSTTPAFDWEDRSTWEGALEGVTKAYLCFFPDLAVPGAADTVGAFARLAVERGVDRLVLLSGRGEEEAERAEQRVQEAGADWTVVRATWFSQNFSEGSFAEGIAAGELALPAGDVPEPFVDLEDVADVAVAALTEDGHAGEVYALTGPRPLTFEQAVREIGEFTGRPIRFVPLTPEAFEHELGAQGVPEEFVWLLRYLFSEVLDGRNAHVEDGVQRALGREPADFRDVVARSWAAAS
jgi:uncharacterized protein YbjT (DUF2867 family)